MTIIGGPLPSNNPFKENQSNAWMICDYQGKILFFHHPDSREMSKAEEQGYTSAASATFSRAVFPFSSAGLGAGRRLLLLLRCQERTWSIASFPLMCSTNTRGASPQGQTCAECSGARDEELQSMSSKMSPSGGLTGEAGLLPELEKGEIFTSCRKGRGSRQRPQHGPRCGNLGRWE